jgi:tetratricopeptide (TPR) repeat protein
VHKAALGRSVNAEAFQLYLQGKFYSQRVTQADTDRAIALFRQALALDPGYALAWTGLARVNMTQAGFGFAPIEEGFERAREAAQRALQLAPNLADAHLELGAVQVAHDWDWPAAGASLKRALELAPGDAHVLEGASSLARILGQPERALDLIGRALALDPLSADIHREAALLFMMSHRLEDAAASLQAAIDLNPKGGLSHAFLAMTRMLQGRSEEALAIAAEESHEVFRNLAYTMIHHALGHPAESDQSLQALITEWGWTAAHQVAEAYAYRGEVDKAFEWLETAYAQRDPGVVHTAVDEFLRPLHADPRWLPFLRRLGLADVAPTE